MKNCRKKIKKMLKAEQKLKNLIEKVKKIELSDDILVEQWDKDKVNCTEVVSYQRIYLKILHMLNELN